MSLMHKFLTRVRPSNLASCSQSLIVDQRRSVGAVGWGPYTLHRADAVFAGVRRHPLKYHLLHKKKPHESYGVQDGRDKQPQMGRCVAKLPVKMNLKKDHVYTWCACGQSGRQPLCDGTHNQLHLRVHMKPVRYIPEKDMTAWICMCKQTKNRPFCDGSHATAKYPDEYTEEDLKDMRSKGTKL